jgi:hypothetical protein
MRRNNIWLLLSFLVPIALNLDVKNLENNYLQGQNNYPKTVTAAYNISS